MQKLFYGIAICLCFSNSLFSQDKSLFSRQIDHAEAIVEGKIIAQESFWNDTKTMILTRNTVEVYKSLKGNIKTSTFDFISQGGRVENTLITTLKMLRNDDAGLFFCTQNKKNNTWDLMPQSYVLYDKARQHAVTPNGLIFNNIESDLYQNIQQQTGKIFEAIQPQDIFYMPQSEKVAARGEAINIESFVPTTVTGGTRTKLTINGTGFGASRGTNGNILFADSEFGGTLLRGMFGSNTVNNNYAQTDVISWSDTKIEVYVPSFAGTGEISVVNNNKEEFRSFDKLNVRYSIATVPPPPLAQGRRLISPSPNADLVNKNGIGGYSIYVTLALFQNANLLNAVVGGLNAWRCATNINYELSSTSSSLEYGVRGVSLINVFEHPILGMEVISQYQVCSIGQQETYRLDEFQIFFNLNETNRQGIDLQSQIMQLLGLASQIRNVNDANDLMYYKLPARQQRRTLNMNNLDAVAYMRNRSTGVNDCGQNPMVWLSAGNCGAGLEKPVARFSADKTEFCGATNAVVTFKDESLNSSTIAWTFQGGTPATSNQRNPRVTYTTAGKFEVSMTVTNPAGTAIETKKEFIIIGQAGLITVNLGADKTICQGQSVSLDAGTQAAGSTFEWSNGATTQTILVRNAGTYSVTVKKDGCSASSSIKISLNNTEPVDAGANQTICVGQSAQLKATGGTTYSWTPATGLSATNIANPIAKPTRTTTYYVSTNSGIVCGIVRDSVRITVETMPIIDFPDTTIVCAIPATILTAGDDFPDLNYQWSDGQNTRTIIVQTGGKYVVKVSNRNGCTVSDSTFVIFSTSIKPAISPSAITICAGESVRLSASGGTSYEWQGNATTTPNSPTITVAPRVTTTYTVRMAGIPIPAGVPIPMNMNPCLGSAQVTVTVVPRPTLELGADIVSCDNAIILDSKVDNADYLWSDGTKTKSISINRSGLYSVTITPKTCPTAVLRDSVRVTFVSLDLGADTVRSCGEAVTLDSKLTTQNTRFLWSTGATTPTLRVTRSGKYVLTATINGCNRTLRDSVTVIFPELKLANRDTIRVCQNEIMLNAGNAGAKYLWNDGSTAQTLRVTKAGFYRVTVTPQNCAVTLKDSVYVTFSSLDLGNDLSTCRANWVLDAKNSGAKYLWNDNSTAQRLTATRTGTYFVSVTDTCGKVMRDTINITFQRLANPFVSDTTRFCGTSAILDAGNNGATYLWNDNSKNKTLNITREGIYEVTLRDSCNNELKARTVVLFYKKPTLSLSSNKNIRTCADSVVLEAKNVDFVGNSGQTTTYLWSTGATAKRLAVRQNGTYILAVQTACGDLLRDTVTVNFFRMPTVDFNFQISGTENGTVTFTNNTPKQTDDSYTYSWEFGDGKTATTENAANNYQKIGNYRAALTVRSQICGQSRRVEKNVPIVVAGIKDELNDMSLKIYPNPSSSGFFTIEMNASTEKTHLRITDASGRLIKQHDLSPNTTHFTIPLGNVAKGVYVVEIRNNKYNSIRKLMVD